MLYLVGKIRFDGRKVRFVRTRLEYAGSFPVVALKTNK